MNTTATVRRIRAQTEIDSLFREFCGQTKDKNINASFDRLVRTVRQNSDLLRRWEGARQSSGSIARIVLTGLFNLACFHRAWLRSCEDWKPQGTSARAKFSSLVRYLIDRHPVPGFLIDSWLQEGDSTVRTYQQWYIHMARTGTIRGTDTPFTFNRQQAKCFASAPDHFTPEEAIRWGRSCRMVETVGERRQQLTTRRRLKQNKAHAQCWYHGEWKPVAIPNFLHLDDAALTGRYWTIRQILHRGELIQEGRQMSHCVAEYFTFCVSGQTSIWTMKLFVYEQPYRRLTVEIDPEKCQISTALGHGNRDPLPEERRVLEAFAAANHLTIAAWV